MLLGKALKVKELVMVSWFRETSQDLRSQHGHMDMVEGAAAGP